MAQKIYQSQIQAKIDRLLRERKQVLEHLGLLDGKIKTSKEAIKIMAEEALSNANEYNTELYTYRTYKRHFHGKLRQFLLVELKSEPDRYFTVNELIERVLIKCGQEPIIHPQHTVSMRAALKYWLDKDVVERLEINVVDVKWKFKDN